MTERLIILNLPHFNGLRRELANNPAQQKASAYARDFQSEDAASKLTAEGLTFWVKDPAAKSEYVEAFKRSSFEGMLNYYKANYPRPPYREDSTGCFAERQVFGPDDSWIERHSAAAGGAQRHLELDRRRSDARDVAECRPFCSAGRR